MIFKETKIQELRHRVVLFRRRIVEAEDGSFAELWAEGDSVWAKVESYSGREVYNEGWNAFQEGSQTKYKVTMRYRRGRFDRLKWGEIILALLCPPLEDGRGKWMVCLMYAKEGEENNS